MAQGGIPIRVRRTNLDVPADTPSLGELFFHTTDSKLGVYDGSDVVWYPGIMGDYSILGQGQKLTGKDSTDATTIELNFDTPGSLQIIHTPSSQVLADFSQSGVTLHNPNVAQTQPGGHYNLMTHPGFLSSLFPTTSVSTADGLPWIGPNTYLWAATGSTGDLSAVSEYMAGLGSLGFDFAEANTLKLSCTVDTNGVGLRSWVFETGLHQDHLSTYTYYQSVFGPVGQTMQIRIGKGGSYTSVTVTGTGAWQRVAVPFPTHTISEDFGNGSSVEPYAIDMCYNPQAGDWYIAEPNLQSDEISSTEIIQDVTMFQRLAIANRIYKQTNGVNMYGTDNYYHTFSNPFPKYDATACPYDVVYTSSPYALTLSNQTNTGLTMATVDGTASGFWTFAPTFALRGALTDIS